MSGIEEVVRKILERRANIPDTRSLLVGVSGIDGCGKGYLAAQLQAHLALHSLIPTILNVDGWLNLPQKRFDSSAPAVNFYENAIRLDQFFSKLVLPLRDQSGLRVSGPRSYNPCADRVPDPNSVLKNPPLIRSLRDSGNGSDRLLHSCRTLGK